MSTAKTIVKNFGFLSISEFVNKAVSFILIIFIARYLEDVGLGKYSFAFAVTGLAAIFADLGMYTYVIKEVAKDRAKTKEFLSTMLTIKGLLLLAIYAVLAAFFLTKRPSDFVIVTIAAVAYLMNGLTDPFRAIFTAYEKNEYYALASVAERITAFALGYFVLVNGYGINAFIAVFIISYSFSFIIAATVTWKSFSRFTISISPGLIKEMIKSSLPFWLTTLFMSFYFKVDSIILTAMKGYAVVGWYNAAYKLVEALSFIPFVTLGAVFPAMSKLHKQSPKLSKLLYKKTFNYMLVIALPIAVGTTMLSQRIISFIYPQSFSQAVTVLQIIIWAEALLFINYIMGYLLNSIDKQMLLTKTAAICAGVNLAGNLLLIQRYGHIGAAATAVITQLTSFAILLYYCNKNNYKVKLAQMIKPMIATISIMPVIIITKNFHLAVIVFASGAAYFIALFLMKIIGKEDIDMVMSMITGH